jgi:hypothetical protein
VRIYVHPDLKLRGDVLTDTRLRMHYTLTTDTAWLLRYIMRNHRADQVVAATARHKDIAALDAREALYKLLGYLNTFGGARVVRMTYGGMATMRMRFSWRSRYNATLGGISKAMFHAYGAITVTLSVLWYGMCLIYGVPLDWAIMPAAILVSCAFHELGHIWAVKRMGQPAVLLASVGYAAVMYVQTAKRQSRIIAAAGPCAAALPYLLYALFAGERPTAYVAIAVALTHACSLLPYFADGKTLWRNV